MTAGRKSKAQQLHGLLVVDKPGLVELSSPASQLGDSQPGERPPRLPTSHDIVNRVRRWSDEKRIGHTGTLDPFASGVLVLTIGNTTRLTEYHQGHDKQYIGEIQLGEATDTYDCTGTVTETAAVPNLNETEIEAALSRFRGTIMQVPPAYSAIKQDGKTSYQQARQGKEVALDPRSVTFYRLELLEFIPPATLRIDIHCSTGTYIRSLAYDLGKALGTVATLTYLRRTAVGPFTIEQAHRLDEIEKKATAGELAEWLQPTTFGLLLPSVQLDEVATRRLGFGQQVKLPLDCFTPLPNAAAIPEKGSLAQAIDPNGELTGIICCMISSASQNASQNGDLNAGAGSEQAVWRADKWFVDSQMLKSEIKS